jgi:ATP phosphoribosyltransferase regulatory subunit HisZ
LANPFAALVGSVTSAAAPAAALSVRLNELPAEVNQPAARLTGFAAWVARLESHLSGKLKEVRRELREASGGLLPPQKRRNFMRRTVSEPDTSNIGWRLGG